MVRPIETDYNGYRFRSRQKARWAVFLDQLQIKYQYQRDGPDFFLPDDDCWMDTIPLKTPVLIGEELDLKTDESSAFGRLCELSFASNTPGDRGLLVIGDPWPGKYHIAMVPFKDSYGSPEMNYCEFNLCHHCGALIAGVDNLHYRYSRRSKICLKCNSIKNKRLHPVLIKGFEAANQMQFKKRNKIIAINKFIKRRNK